MHARMTVGDDVLLMGSDAPPQMYEPMKGMTVSVSIDKPADADRVFAALAEGGTRADADPGNVLGAALRHADRSVRHAVDDQLRTAKSVTDKSVGHRNERSEPIMTTGTVMKSLDEREVTITRLFDAPRTMVFKAWTDAEQLAQWWGPKGFTNPVCEIDARVGGALRIHMRSPDGSIYPMKGEIREINPPERIVFTNIALDAAGHHIIEGLTVVTFAEEGGKTRLTVQTRGSAMTEQAVG